MPNVFLEGKNVFLSPVMLDDASFIMDCMNNDEVRILARSRRDVINEANIKGIVEDLQKNREGFIVWKKIEQERIGYGLLLDQDQYNREAMLAISLGKAENRGKGYGSEAIELLLKHGFINLNLESIYLGVYEYNVSAIKAYEKVGFKYVGKRRHSRIIGNRIYDEIIMDMISEEYFQLYGNEEMNKYNLG